MRVMAFALAGALAVAARADTGAGDLTPEVSALVDKWLAAQNGGDFAAYEKLYARKFTGVRRSGARSVSLDRAGWLRDRQRMFARPMKVSASDVRIAAAATSARVQLTQEWESGSYHDRGPKQLVVVREDGAARIAREELLASATAPTAAAMAASAELAFVVGRYAIVAERADDGWAAGAARLDDEGEPVVTSKRAANLPPELSRWVGRKLALYGNKGPSCTATVRELRIVSLVIPHFGMREDWKDSHKSARDKAADAWSMGGASVGAVLEGCDGEPALFARAAELPPLATVAGVRDQSLRGAAIRAMRALPSWRALQKSYLAQGGKGPWDRTGSNAEVIVERWQLPTPLLTVSAHSFDGCAGFGGEIFAVFDAATLTLVAEPTALRPEAAMMLDGAPAFIGGQSWSDDGVARQLVPLGGRPRKIEVPYLDCPC